MADAEEVADILAFEFLKRGNFSVSTGPVEVPELGRRAASIASVAEVRDGFGFGGEYSFASLAVQSIGFEEGTERPRVHVYLTHGSVRLMKSVPSIIDGVPVVVQKMGPISVRPEMAASVTNRGHIFEKNGRVCCGTSCAPTSENCAGTLGALVRERGAGEIFLLSNNHVFSGCNHVPANQPILAPSGMDGRPDARAPGEIGRHCDLIELRSGSPNFVTPCDMDLALARATSPDQISSWQGDTVDGYDTPVVVASPLSMMKVKKFGRTTHLTFGTVESRVKVPTPMLYSSKHFKGTVWFREMWTVRANDPDEPFAIAGDSGSLVVSENGSQAVGVVFAANKAGDYAWIIPMPRVKDAFGGIELVGQHHA